MFVSFFKTILNNFYNIYLFLYLNKKISKTNLFNFFFTYYENLNKNYILLKKNYNYKNSSIMFSNKINKNIWDIKILKINNKINNKLLNSIYLFLFNAFTDFVFISLNLYIFYSNNFTNYIKESSSENLTNSQKNDKFNLYYRDFVLKNQYNINEYNFIKLMEIIDNFLLEYIPDNIYKNVYENNILNIYKNNFYENNVFFKNYNDLILKLNFNKLKLNFNIFFCKLFFKILNFEKRFFFKYKKTYSFSNAFWDGFYLNEENKKVEIKKITQYYLNINIINVLKKNLIINNFLENKIFNLNKVYLKMNLEFLLFNINFIKKINNVNYNFSMKIYYNLNNLNENSYFYKNSSMIYFYENFSFIEEIFNYFFKINKLKNKTYFGLFFFFISNKSKFWEEFKIFFYKNKFIFFKNVDFKNFSNNSFFIKGISLLNKEYFYNIFYNINNFNEKKICNIYFDLNFKIKNELKKFNFNYLNFFLSYNKYKNELLDYNFIRVDERFKKHFFKISYKTSNQNLILTSMILYDLKLKQYYNSILDFYVNNAKPVFLVFYDFFKKLIIPVFIFFYILISLIMLGYLPFNKILFAWIVSIMSFYWLMSGFVFFIKKYQHSNFTAAIQRFWKRSYIIFWLLEIFVFLIFMYLTLNANQESFYMFDNIQFFKTKLYSWRAFIFKLYPITFLLILSNIFILALRWTIFSKLSIWLVIFSGGLLYVFWFEFYQFMFISTYHTNFDWIFDFDEYKWEADIDEFKTRNINNFVVLLIVLKFWHIVFIVFFWLFFILRSLELTKVTYTLFSANLQNILILYMFSWILMYPWFKYAFRHFLDMPYKWFYINNRSIFNRILFYDFNTLYKGLLDYINVNNHNYRFNTNNFIYLNSVSKNYDFNSFRKDYLTNNVITSLKLI